MLVTNCLVFIVCAEMESHIMDSVVETDGAGPDQNVAEVGPFEAPAAGAPVDIELQQQQQVRRFVDNDGVTQMVVLTAARYDEIVKQRPRVGESLYDQLSDERRQRLDIAEKYRSCREALARTNDLMTRYRQLLIRHRLQLEPAVDDAVNVGVSELPEMYFNAANHAEVEKLPELRARGLAASTAPYSRESVQTTGEAPVPNKTESTHRKTSNGTRQSVLESDEPVMMVRPVCVDDPLHDHWKNSADEALQVAASAEEKLPPPEKNHHRQQQQQQQQLLDEAKDAMNAVPIATSSTMSRDLLQKVLEQNARLKLILKKILDAQGLSVREFLVSCGVYVETKYK